MKYSNDTRADSRVVEAAPAPLPFPGRRDAAPAAAGVVILCNDIDDVIYVQWGDSIQVLVESAATAAAAASANRLRWFRTANLVAAKALGKALIRRYRPEGNGDDSQWAMAPV
jgi:hypothetical protein